MAGSISILIEPLPYIPADSIANVKSYWFALMFRDVYCIFFFAECVVQQQSIKPSPTTMLGFAGSRAPRIPSHQQYEGHLDQAIPKQEIELQFPPSIR